MGALSAWGRGGSYRNPIGCPLLVVHNMIILYYYNIIILQSYVSVLLTNRNITIIQY